MAQDASKVKGFFLYFDQYEIISTLSNEQKAMLLDALFMLLAGHEYEIADSAVDMAFKFIKLSHEQRLAKYAEKSEKARESANMRWQKNNANACERIKRNANDAITINNNNKQKTNNIYMGTPAATNSKKFIPPSLEEVQEYCSERNNGVDAQRFVDFYTANGWMVGKNKVKDWKACVRTWERNTNSTGYRPNGFQTTTKIYPKPAGWDD